MTKNDILDYSPIGGHDGGNILKNLQALEIAFASNEYKRNKQNYILIGIAFDIGMRLAFDKISWESFCKLERWKNRKIKPQADGDTSDILKFVALFGFSTAKGTNDDRAMKYGRVMDYCFRKKIAAGDVANYIEKEKLDDLYDCAVREFPRRKKPTVDSEVQANDKDDDDSDNDDASDQANQDPIDDSNENAEKVGKNEQLIVRKNPKKEIIELEYTSWKQFMRLMSMKDGERVGLTVECFGPTSGWVALKIVKVRDLTPN